MFANLDLVMMFFANDNTAPNVKKKLCKSVYLGLLGMLMLGHQAQSCEIDITTTGVGITPDDYMNSVESIGCRKGEQVFMNLVHDNYVRYVVHNICDLRHNVFVDRTEHDFEGKYNNQDEWENRNNGIVYIYRGKRLYENVYE